MGEFLVSLSPVPLSGGAVLVEGHVVLALGVGVLVQRRGVRVVPVLLKLLAENALPGQLLLPGEQREARVKHLEQNKHCQPFLTLIF